MSTFSPALVAGLVVVLGTAAGCSSAPSTPAGYERIGTVGGDVLYAKVARESDGDYAEVVLRTNDGEELCDGRGPLMTSPRMPAICDGTSAGLYVYVTRAAKDRPGPSLCRRHGGEAVHVTRLRTDDTWAADFVVMVDRSGDELPFVSPCNLLTAG